ncbi:winged helix-turn-helix transcriptional regulator [Candidatus Woesearchaeota archaeon]|nr:winged helix-turn-helix transcriptional regulator [Candidatus Woesearchaeota archaeon]
MNKQKIKLILQEGEGLNIEFKESLKIKFEPDDFFKAIFYRPLEKTVGKTVGKILDLIRQNPKITREELSEKTGLSVRGIEWNLKNLKKKKIIKRIGPAKGGHWEIQ